MMQDNVSPQQAYTNRVYHLLNTQHGIRLSREQYSYHVGRFAEILQRYGASHEEAEAAGDRIVERYPHYRKIDAVQALQDVRTHAARSTPPRETEADHDPQEEPIDWTIIQRASARAFEDYSDAELERRVDEADQGDEWAQLELDRRREAANA